MADLSQTPANVITDVASGAPIGFGDIGTAGEAILAGQPLYQTNATNQRWFKALCAGNALQAGYAGGITIALDSAPGVGQPISLLRSGRVNLGATLVAGETYVVSANAGAICPIGDLVTNNYTSILGYAVNTSFLLIPPGGPPLSNTARTTDVT